MRRLLLCGVPFVACLLSACDLAPRYVPPAVAIPAGYQDGPVVNVSESRKYKQVGGWKAYCLFVNA